jgi:hypothetical protein
MLHIDASAEDAVIDILQGTGPCCLDDLVTHLPNHNWSKIFVAVDRMSRDGRLVLRRISRSGYQVPLPSPKPAYQEVLA